MNAYFDFSKSFPLSDVVLIAEDAEGNKRELHASRMYLAMYSSFFERMLFSDFKEANSNSIEVSCSYEALKLVLEAIYEHTREYSKVKQTYDVSVLMELYKAADYLDIRFICGMCVEQMLNLPSVEMATGVLSLIASGLDLNDTLMGILKKMDPNGLQNFLAVDNSHPIFSKEDVATIYQVIAKKSLPDSKSYAFFFCTRILDLYEEFQDPLIDLTKKWPWSDVLIKGEGPRGIKILDSLFCPAIG